MTLARLRNRYFRLSLALEAHPEVLEEVIAGKITPRSAAWKIGFYKSNNGNAVGVPWPGEVARLTAKAERLAERVEGEEDLEQRMVLRRAERKVLQELAEAKAELMEEHAPPERSERRGPPRRCPPRARIASEASA